MEKSIDIVFMGTPDFAAPTLIELVGDNRFNVMAVVTCQDKPSGRGRKLTSPPIKLTALERGIPVLQPGKVGAPETVKSLAEMKPDYLVVVAYGQILPSSVLAIPGTAPVNLHASLLPRWRGAAPIHRAFLAGDRITGVCSMLMDEGLDTGDILLCRETHINEEDTLGTLTRRLARLGAVVMKSTLKSMSEEKIVPVKQELTMATYAKKPEKSEFVIEWGKEAEDVSRLIRGLAPAPGAVACIGGREVKPLFARARADDADSAPGEVTFVSEHGIEVACGKGSVVITKLKPSGKGPMTAHAFSLGARIKPGDRFTLPAGHRETAGT